MAVTLYRQVGKGKSRRYQKVNLGRGRRPADLTGPYFLRYSLADGTRPWEHVGDDLDEAIAARDRKKAYFEALDANVPVVQDQDDSGRTKITDAVYQWFADLQLFQGKDQQGKSEKTLRAYNYRLGFFLDFTAQSNLRYLDQIDRKQLLRYVKFLREHESDLDDRTVHNVFETLNTFLRTRDIFIAGKILAELDYAEKPPKLDPDSYLARMILRGALYLGECPEESAAVQEAALAISGRHPWHLAGFAVILADWRKPTDAEAIYTELVARARRQYVSPALLAIAATAATKEDEAICHAHKAFEIRDPVCILYFSKHSGVRHRLDAYARFREMLLEVGFE
jgi:hypothetical protein